MLLDRHPEWESVWVVGGGSGHGFKLGPEAGRRAADLPPVGVGILRKS